LKTHHVHVRGRVQGVGFRPFVFRLATELGLRGTVSNGADGVHIHLQAPSRAPDQTPDQTPDDVAADFVSRVQAEAPAMARLTGVSVAVLDQPPFVDFQIVDSRDAGQSALWLTPDLAMCAACRAELRDPDNRRFGYPFITCTDCGPRYSIAHRLPFDRAVTTMSAFPMCARCQAEYDDPADRRFYAQTDSCPACGPRLSGWAGDEPLPAGEELAAIADLLRAGSIVAVKGIGGFLLVCDATSAAAVRRLRARKHRPSKPFAVLYPDLDTVRGDCCLAPDEEAELTGPAAPIVLLPLLSQLASGLALNEIAPGLAQLGVMLPYAPLLALLAERLARPLVATSGNISGSPIAFRDDEARAQLGTVADAFLTHDRAIVVPQDDSVLRFSARQRRRILLRRGRGLAPTLPPRVGAPVVVGVLAFGASLKSTLAWSASGYDYVSQYLGDLESFDTQQNFRRAQAHFEQLLRQRPRELRADLHPGYFSTQLAEELAAAWQVPLRRVPHHAAHLAAVLAEHPPSDAPTLGLIWDGTGYGPDGHVWGGEFLLSRGPDASGTTGSPERLAHFAYFDALLSDKMPREPRLSAFALARHLPGGEALLRPKFTVQEFDLYTKLLSSNQLKTSSIGRLFDAVASVLGLADRVSYEGEAALLLETAAAVWLAQAGPSHISTPYLADWNGHGEVPTAALLQAVLDEHRAGRPGGEIAARFHQTLVSLIQKVARAHGLRRLAFSGGVWQNALLVDLATEQLGADFELLFHEQLAPNDENIAFGQLAAGG